MVFESISTGLSNLGKSGTKTSKSVVKSASNATKKLSDPLIDVAKKTAKTVPFSGEIDSWELAHDHFAIDLAKQDLANSCSKSISSLRKLKIPATKISGIENCYNIILEKLEHENSLKQGEKNSLSMIKSLKKSLTKGIPSTFDANWLHNKKMSLTKKQLDIVKNELDTLHFKTIKKFHDLQNLIHYITVAPTTALDPKNELKSYRKVNHDLQDDLISAKFDVVTQYKKLYYLLLELEKQTKKETIHKNSLTRTKIQNILKIKIPGHLKIVKELRIKIDDTEKSVYSSIHSYESNIQARLSDINEWLLINKKTTKSGVGIITRETKIAKKNLISVRGKLEKITNKILALSPPFSEVELLQSMLKEEHNLHMSVIESETHASSLIFSDYISQARDIELGRQYIQEHIDRGFDKRMVHKELALQTGLVNRIHAKQIKALDNLQKKLKILSASSTDSSLNVLEKRIVQERKQILSKQKEYKSNKQKYSEDVFKKSLKTLRKGLLYSQHNKIALNAKYESKLKKELNSYLKIDKNDLEKNIEYSFEKLKLIDSQIRKSDIQAKENELSSATLGSKEIAKKALEFEHQMHKQEVFKDTFEHHIDHEKDYLLTLHEQLSGNAKDVKKLDKVIQKMKKVLKLYVKDLKKDPIAKQII